MKKCLWVLLNKTFKKDLELLYGVGSSVDITEVKKCTTNNQYLISCTLKISKPELFSEVGEEGLNLLMTESWKLTGSEKDNFVLLASYDITP